MVFDRLNALQSSALVTLTPHVFALNLFLIGMIFPPHRLLRGIVTSARASRFISLASQGANKTPLVGLNPYAPPLFTAFKHQQTRKMSRDVSGQSDIGVMGREPDGSFKRAPSSFRNFIQKGGQFPPEKGTPSPNSESRFCFCFYPNSYRNYPIQTAIISMCRTLAVSILRKRRCEARLTTTPCHVCFSLGDEDIDHPKAQRSR